MHRFTIVRTRSLVAGAILAATAPAASAQGLAGITGNVHHARDMVPLAGAQVSLEGTAIGSLADREGRYLIANVPPGEHVAVVTMIGYATERVSVTLEAGQTRRLDFTLEQAPFALDELIVTGTAGEVRAKELGHAVDVITSRDIESMALRGAEEVLAGRAPGVTVSTNSGQQGARGSVRIRGLTTVSQTVEPLLYIDGVRVFNLPTRTGWDSRTAVNPLQDVAPSDIERIEVIKGPAATTLYGTEAAGGVIQIFTKAGIAGTPIWTAELAMGVKPSGVLSERRRHGSERPVYPMRQPRYALLAERSRRVVRSYLRNQDLLLRSDVPRRRRLAAEWPHEARAALRPWGAGRRHLLSRRQLHRPHRRPSDCAVQRRRLSRELRVRTPPGPELLTEHGVRPAGDPLGRRREQRRRLPPQRRPRRAQLPPGRKRGGLPRRSGRAGRR